MRSKFLVPMLLAMIFAFGFPARAAADVSGRWLGTSSDGDILQVFLIQSGSSVTGRGGVTDNIAGDFAGTYTLSGNLSGSTLTLAVTGASTNCATLNATAMGTVSGTTWSASLTGIDCDGLPLNFTFVLTQQDGTLDGVSGIWEGTTSLGEIVQLALSQTGSMVTGTDSFFDQTNFGGAANISGTATTSSFSVTLTGSSSNCSSLNQGVTGTLSNNSMTGTVSGTTCNGASTSSTFTASRLFPDLVSFLINPASNLNLVPPGGTVNLMVSAISTVGSPTLNYSWSATCPNLGSSGGFSSMTAQNPTWTAPGTNTTGVPRACTIQVTVNTGTGATNSASFTQLVDTQVYSTADAFTGNNSQTVAAPFWQSNLASYTFMAVSHPSLSGMSSRIGVALNAVVKDGNTLFGQPLEFTLSSGRTQKVFITYFGHPFINSVSIPDALFITGTSNDIQGQVVINPVASHPGQLAGPAGVPGRGFADVTSLNLWGAIVIQNTTTGFAMEFIGDAQNSRTFNTPNFSGLN